MVRGKKVILLPVGEEELSELYVKHFVSDYVYGTAKTVIKTAVGQLA
jgi:hypothetical protein